MSRINKQHLDLGEEKSISLKKNVLAAAIGVALGGASAIAIAALPVDTRLFFDAGVVEITSCLDGSDPATGCNLTFAQVTDIGGSYFRMNNGGAANTEKTPLSMFAPIILGSTQTSSGQHIGTVTGGESPAIDNPWNFFINTGMHSLTSPVLVVSDFGATQTLDFTGWGVNWGNFGPGGTDGGTIPMGDPATIVCDVDCSNGDGYNLDMLDVHVPVAFASVPYSLHLEGTISLPGFAPILVDDPGNVTIVGNPRTIDVTANDTSGDDFDPASLAIVIPPNDGMAVANADETITYTPNTGPDFVGTNTFEYTINSGIGTPPDPEPGGSGPALVTVDVQANVKPVAVNDTFTVSTAVLDVSPQQVVKVLLNDTDANNAPGLPGGIDIATVAVLSQPATGQCQANADGTVTYSQTPPAVEGQFTCTYKVSDIDTVNTPRESDAATLSITVRVLATDWPVALDPDIIPVLFYEAGVPGDPTNKGIPPKSGSYFTMQVTPTRLIYTVMEPGPAGGVVIGHDQPAGISHIDEPTGNEETSLDLGWSFFTNTGFTITKNGGIAGNPDGSLKFNGENSQGRWIITWGGIPEIDLGGDRSGTFPDDLGFAGIACTPAPCEDQSSFELEYAAHVPPGDPSGFGGVPYTLFLNGTVRFLDGTLKTSTGTVASESRLLAGAVIASDPDAEVDVQCAGDCFDYTIDNVTASSASIVIPLAGGVPRNPVWRILDNGTWRDFDTTVDTVKSAPLPAGTACPDPGDSAYVDLAPAPSEDEPSPSAGDYCIELTITDNGLNDLDPTTGIISDPSGMGSVGVEFVDTRTSSTSESWGCSIMANNVDRPQRSDWWLLAGFIAWLGWSRGRSRQH